MEARHVGLAVLTTAILALATAHAEAAVYWTSGSAIGRANNDGSNADPTVIDGLQGLGGIAVDDAHIYWANAADGAIGRANLDGSGIYQRFLSTGAGTTPTGVAVDGGHVYWVG